MRAIDRKNLDFGKAAMILQEGSVHIPGRERGIDSDRKSSVLSATPRLQLA
jgi:hypothetical protein